MMRDISFIVAFLLSSFSLIDSFSRFLYVQQTGRVSFQKQLRITAYNPQYRRNTSPTPRSYATDSQRSIREGSLVEYVTGKGSKRLALVNKRIGYNLEVSNDARKVFTVSISRVTHHINGSFAFGDLLRLTEMLGEIKPIQVERLWESSFASDRNPCNIATISKQIYGSTDPVRMFVTMKLMSSFGNVFFEVAANKNNDSKNSDGGRSITLSSSSTSGVGGDIQWFVPLPPSVVQENLRSRAALKEFKLRFNKVMTQTNRVPSSINPPNPSTQSGGSGIGIGGMPSSYNMATLPDMPERIFEVLTPYAEGLKQLVVKGHPWVVNNWARRAYDEQSAAKGRELLDFLELAPSVKNAKRVLEVMGTWPLHTNIEKYVMALRDKFPPEVLDEAQYLLDNAEVIPDPDERLRRDLRHLGCYAIDSEGAAEVDDALSIEHLEDGREKLWVHIADVSRWIRPGSQLSLEAERRMVSVYMPDERISMFPYTLSSELLSLGAGVDSYALSCGVTLDEEGEVTSFEVCPSKVRVTRRLSYVQLDDLFTRGVAGMGRGGSAGGAAGGGITGGVTGEITAAVEDPHPGGVLEGSISNNNNNNNNDQNDVKMSEKPSSSSSMGIDGLISSDLLINPNAKDNNNPTSTTGRTTTITGGSDSGSSSGGTITNSNGYPNHIRTSSTPPRQSFAPSIPVTSADAAMKADLTRLNQWAVIRHGYRQRKNALDEYLRHRTELSLSVKRDPKSLKYVVSGYTSWSNATSMSLVSEYMILMCQTIGVFCQNIGAPVWYKVQTPVPPLSSLDLELQGKETPFLRTARIMRHLKAANDSKTPGPHCSSGSAAYVQCTSPIRRYHDLYNHYRLKTAMHGASLGQEWAERAIEEAGISRLDSMATAEERLHTLNAVRLVTRHRDQYWLQIYINKLVATLPKVVFKCLVVGPCRSNSVEHLSDLSDSPFEDLSITEADMSMPTGADSTEDNLNGTAGEGASEGAAGGSAVDASTGSPASEGGTLHEALILQLGSFYRYKLFIPPLVPVDGSSGGSGSTYGNDRKSNRVHSDGVDDSVSDAVPGPASTTVYRRLGSTNSYSTNYLPTNRQPVTGDLISCHLYRRNTNPVSYLLLPADVDMDQLPPGLADELLAVGRKTTAADAKADEVGFGYPDSNSSYYNGG